jgi:uncharacterized linocin/CFP29 family protein
LARSPDRSHFAKRYAVREVQPLAEVRSPFMMKILELDYAARGACDLNLDAVIAVAESFTFRVLDAESAIVVSTTA